MVVIGLPDGLQAFARRGSEVLLTCPGPHKDMGVLLQRKAFENPNMLPIYGSSELAVLDVPNRPDNYFLDGKHGFQVCPVGRGGSTSLIIAQRLAAVGEAVAGRKMVILLSSSWFRRHGVVPDQYVGNFSELQATRALTSHSLSYGLRHRFALRMHDQPLTLGHRHELAKAVWRLRMPQDQSTALESFKTMPLLVGEGKLLAEDVACTFADSVFELASPHQRGAFVEIQTPPPVVASEKDSQTPEEAEAEFAAVMKEGKEWVDFELLLDTLTELHAKPLIVTIPMEGEVVDSQGIRRETRLTLYYNRVEQLCRDHGFAFASMVKHEYTPGFLYKHHAHLSNEGWPFVNQIIDRFVHDLPLDDGTTAVHRNL